MVESDKRLWFHYHLLHTRRVAVTQLEKLKNKWELGKKKIRLSSSSLPYLLSLLGVSGVFAQRLEVTTFLSQIFNRKLMLLFSTILLFCFDVLKLLRVQHA